MQTTMGARKPAETTSSSRPPAKRLLGPYAPRAPRRHGAASRGAVPGEGGSAAPDFDFGRIAILPKLTVGHPSDRYEQEADEAAERVMRMPDPDAAVSPPTARVEGSALQRKCAGCEEEEEVQRWSEGTPACGIEAPPIVHDVLRSSGQPLDAATRAFMEPRFAYDFGHVRVHTDARAAESARAVSALAYTAGSHIVLASDQYAAEGSAARKLLAHELAHVIQQDGGMAVPPLQRQHVADTGWRYAPPASVTRSVVEIQGIVGATPDGVYGPDTRNAVIRYQTTLQAAGLYTGSIDGKWADLTDVAHVAFALTRPSRGGYNCSGFAFKRFTWIDLVPTRTILSTMTALPSCSAACGPWQHKFFFWEVDVQVLNTVTGALSAAHRDFHIVGGQTDGAGLGPATVMSKNGQRPVVGPAAPATFEPVSGPALDQDNNPAPNHEWVISGTAESCYCNSTLP